jgi:signal transduction histidine kinase
MAVGIALASPELASLTDHVTLWGFVLLAYTAVRTASPIDYVDDTRSLLRVLAEVALGVSAVTATGYWRSPYVVCLITAVVVAGCARGFAFAIRIGLVSTVAVAIPFAASASDVGEALRESGQWAAELVLVAMVAGHARRVWKESADQQTAALDRLGRLAEANSLLSSLHRVAQDLPSSLDLDEVLDSTMANLRSLFSFDAAVLLVVDASDGRWLPARAVGVNAVPTSTDDLPTPLRRAALMGPAAGTALLRLAGEEGVAPGTRSGLYVALHARRALVGLLALEHRDGGHFSRRDADLLRGLAEPAALALDNARWFRRLRTVGADEERGRIARDLHDHLGQSLAYVAFELDRVGAHAGDDQRAELSRLRDEVRGMIGEVRETLYDLRTDVTEAQGLATTLSEFLDRVGRRSGLEVSIDVQESARLPLRQEREVWGIAREAVANVERHAGAAHLRVTWRCDGHRAELTVVDDGRGLPTAPTRLDAYGIAGMRERASSIGARLEIRSVPGAGTAVRCVHPAAEEVRASWA